MTDRWTFGVEPLPQAVEVAPLLRRVAGLVLALEHEDSAVGALVEHLRDAERALTRVAPHDLAPRIGAGAAAGQRVYVDHARDVGAYDPCFPEYEITVEDDHAHGTVGFPIAFEGPPGVVHGGVLATFFDCVIQHHNCDAGVAGKTTSLLVEYRRPTPLLTALEFEIERRVDDGRITSQARLLRDGDVQCRATMHAVAGDRTTLPAVSPRRAPR
jgi:acyl-coenzyme A thioesterase PaaI-like protein